MVRRNRDSSRLSTTRDLKSATFSFGSPPRDDMSGRRAAELRRREVGSSRHCGGSPRPPLKSLQQA